MANKKVDRDLTHVKEKKRQTAHYININEPDEGVYYCETIGDHVTCPAMIRRMYHMH